MQQEYIYIFFNKKTKEIVNKPRVVVIKIAVVYLKMRVGPP